MTDRIAGPLPTATKGSTVAHPPAGIVATAVYLTDEAAGLCRVQPSTIRRAVRCGQIRGRGRPFRILGSELVKYVS